MIRVIAIIWQLYHWGQHKQRWALYLPVHLWQCKKLTLWDAQKRSSLHQNWCSPLVRFNTNVQPKASWQLSAELKASRVTHWTETLCPLLVEFFTFYPEEMMSSFQRQGPSFIMWTQIRTVQTGLGQAWLKGDGLDSRRLLSDCISSGVYAAFAFQLSMLGLLQRTRHACWQLVIGFDRILLGPLLT